MDNSTSTNSKIITVSFMIAGILVGIVVSVLLDSVGAVATGAFGRLLAQDLIHHGLPVLAGIATFGILQFKSGVVVWADEVVSEIRRVVWPSRKDTMAMTLVVCIMLLISGVALGLLDVVSASVIDWLLNRSPIGLLS